MNRYVILETKGTTTQARQEIPKGEHFVGLILTKSTVLVYSTFTAPRVEALQEYNIIGETFTVDEINQIAKEQEQYRSIIAAQRMRLREKISITNVIFNDDATIVFFSDGSKKVVIKDWDESYDKEKAIAIACAKKMLGGYTPLLEVIENSKQNS